LPLPLPLKLSLHLNSSAPPEKLKKLPKELLLLLPSLPFHKKRGNGNGMKMML
jgi:hypothetical protein